MPEPPDAPLVARFDRKRYEQGAYVFVAILVLALIYTAWAAEPRDLIIAMVAFAVIVAVLYAEQRRIQNAPGPQLIIDADGMVMPDHFVHRLPWAAITSARVTTTYKGVQMLVVTIPSASPYGPRGNAWECGIQTIGGTTEVTLGINHFDVDSTQIEAAIARFASSKGNPPA
ncbi:hypothetical protein E8L99_21410 [Phreatobacter aquaticus]|uniref:PH domain-containing protein n=1 Tax=Phreatobacter aquaticus TaxID=2570229 RepID=A0A4D7QVZ3_9HYPH|nr:hypothetical protein [Phreatobacter aquaticus]QCK88132.1 hypothetical protein E8L99_21410 [Phreatobacter aquaticus]